MYLINKEIRKLRKASFYSNRVYYTGDTNDAVFVDMLNIIRDFTQGSLIVHSDINSPTGIFLIPFDEVQENGQVFEIETDENKIKICYSEGLATFVGFNTSLANAIYRMFNEVGIKWLTPNENGMHIPDKLIKPVFAKKRIDFSFRDRGEFGTGGNGATIGQPWEKANGLSFEKRWNNWKRRTGWSYDYTTLSHMGYAFYLGNKAACDENWSTYGANSQESWFNSESGKWYGRIRIEKPAAVQLFKDYIEREYQRAISAGVTFITLGVDPEDGRGGSDDPLPPDGFDGITNWNHADKWWWLANKVAENYLDKPNVKISMQAYGDGATNALAPKFNLLPNVLPNLNPYAFQKAYFPPNTMIDAWAVRITGDASVYDYVNITQWSLGRPNQHHLLGVEQKLKFWHGKKIKGTTYETMDAAAIAHFHYCANELQKDITLNMSDVYDDWLSKMFGDAKHPMKRMIDRWQNNYQGAADPALSLVDLQEASALVTPYSIQWKRIADYKAYVHFIILLDRHDNTFESMQRIFNYMYSIHHLMMVQTPAFLGQNYIAPFNQRPLGENIQHLTYPQIEAQFQNDLISNPKVYDVVPFSFDYNRATTIEKLDDNIWKYGRHAMVYFVPKEPGVIEFLAGCDNSNTQISIFNEDGLVLSELAGMSNYDTVENVSGSAYYLKLYTINVVPGKTYYLSMRGGFNRLKMISNHTIWLSNGADNFDNYALPVQYIYIPVSAKELVVESNLSVVPAVTLADSNTWTWMDTIVDNIRKIDIPVEQRGKLWKIAWGDSFGTVLNLPKITALNRFDYAE